MRLRQAKIARSIANGAADMPTTLSSSRRWCLHNHAEKFLGSIRSLKEFKSTISTNRMER